MSLGRGVYGRIGHTQPRRIAARSLASRVASEVGQVSGESIGYKVRFNDQINPHTAVKLMTDGILLAEVQKDKFLNEYDTLIIDEAHERSLNIDFLLGYLQQLLKKRPDLKLIVTSATIDTDRFSKHFGDAPIIEVSGRTFPVEMRYSPLKEENIVDGVEPMQVGIADAVKELLKERRGDILIFLPGEREIREASDTLTKLNLAGTEILSLYARLSSSEQSKIFQPKGGHRIILSTNVAETSLTVPGIRYVIDTGFAKISRYSHRSKIQRLPVERISQASAAQRAGRCGRVSAGVCIRLYDEDVFMSSVAFTEPEIQRTNLASVILQMKMLGFGELSNFPFVDAPDPRLIKDGYRVLEEIGAVDTHNKVTPLGKKVSRFSVDPRIARMLIEANVNGCLKELIIIAAGLSIQDPKDRPLDKQKLADEVHAVFKDEDSDFMGYLKLWSFFKENKKQLTERKFRRLCKANFLSFNRLREWQDIHNQLSQQAKELKLNVNKTDAKYDVIHMAVLSGLLSHIGFDHKSKEKDYLGARNSRFNIFPGSSLFKTKPKWLVSAELVETTKLYARTNAVIQSEWIEQLASHLVKRNYSEPHWQAKRGQVGAYERITLYGLTLVTNRRINFGPIDPVVSREIFIRFALVEGQIRTRKPFWRHNQQLIEGIHLLEAKARRRDVLISEEAIYAFYDKRLPKNIYSTPLLEKWLTGLGKAETKNLFMEDGDVFAREADEVTEHAYPDALLFNGMALPLQYTFDPSKQSDGLTVKVPHAVLDQIQESDVDRLVPGLLKEKLLWLIRGLPKKLRKNFVPAPSYVEQSLIGVKTSSLPLIQAFAKELKRLTGVYVSEDDWTLTDIPEFLKMNIEVINLKGETINSDSHLATLKRRCKGISIDSGSSNEQDDLEKEGFVGWEFDDLPSSVEKNIGKMNITLYPAIIDEGDSVAIKLISSEQEANVLHENGLKRLFIFELKHDIRFLKKQFSDVQSNRLRYSKIPNGLMLDKKKIDLEDEVISLALGRCFLSADVALREKKVFIQNLADNRSKLVNITIETYDLVTSVLVAYQKVRKSISQLKQINWLTSINDMNMQLDALIYRGFIQDTNFEQLKKMPRYLQAIEKRIEKLKLSFDKDQEKMREMAAIQQQWLKRYEVTLSEHQHDVRLDEIRWMLEELRVSFFAQELKTAFPISVKRINKRWQELSL